MITQATALESVLEEAREDAVKLRLHGHTAQAASIEHVVARITEVMGDYLDWLTEDEAALQSGRSVNWLRGRFAEWESTGMAQWEGVGRRVRRRYRRVIVPRRPNLLLAYQEGRTAS